MRDSSAVYVDFHNADPEGFVRLNTNGSQADLIRLGIVLVDRANLRVSDGEISLDGEIRAPGSEGTWRVLVDWKEVARLHGEL